MKLTLTVEILGWIIPRNIANLRVSTGHVNLQYYVRFSNTSKFRKQTAYQRITVTNP